MKAVSVIILALILAACERSKAPLTKIPEPIKPEPAPSAAASGLKFPDHFDSAWVSPRAGFMSNAIALSGDRYYYWFNSDVNSGAEPDYPYTGTFKTQDDVVELGFPSELATGRAVLIDGKSELYSYRWKIERSEHSVRWHPEHDKPDDNSQNLFPDPHFDPNHPFSNQKSLVR